jgi:hypothetical protein
MSIFHGCPLLFIVPVIEIEIDWTDILKVCGCKPALDSLGNEGGGTHLGKGRQADAVIAQPFDVFLGT